METIKSYVMPVIHLNGTSGQNLMNHYNDLRRITKQLHARFYDGTFHPRDYYVLGAEDQQRATEERHEIGSCIYKLLEYADANRQALFEQYDKLDTESLPR